MVLVEEKNYSECLGCICDGRINLSEMAVYSDRLQKT